jgi:hypothetical protein
MVRVLMTPLMAKTFSIESRELWFQLRQAYLQEELLRPIFVWGVGLGTLLLLVALIWRDERMKMVALILLGATGLAVIPYLQMRDGVARKPHPGDDPSPKVARLRQDSRWVFLTLGGLALGTAIWGARTKYGGTLTIVTLACGVSATATGLWLAAHDAGAMHFTPRKAAPVPRATTEAPPRTLRAEPVR